METFTLITLCHKRDTYNYTITKHRLIVSGELSLDVILEHHNKLDPSNTLFLEDVYGYIDEIHGEFVPNGLISNCIN